MSVGCVPIEIASPSGLPPARSLRMRRLARPFDVLFTAAECSAYCERNRHNLSLEIRALSRPVVNAPCSRDSHPSCGGKRGGKNPSQNEKGLMDKHPYGLDFFGRGDQNRTSYHLLPIHRASKSAIESKRLRDRRYRTLGRSYPCAAVDFGVLHNPPVKHLGPCL